MTEEVRSLALVAGTQEPLAWRPISELPETDPKFLGNGIRVLLFSRQFGIRTGEAFNTHGRKWANVSNLHGNAIDDWGASHFMLLPDEPVLQPSKE